MTPRSGLVLDMFKLKFITEKRPPDVSTLSRTFYDLSVSHNLYSKDKMLQFGAARTKGLNLSGQGSK